MGDEADGDTRRDGEGQRHQNGHQHHRHGRGHVVPFQTGKWCQETGRNKDKRRRGCEWRNRGEKRFKEQA